MYDVKLNSAIWSSGRFRVRAIFLEKLHHGHLPDVTRVLGLLQGKLPSDACNMTILKSSNGCSS